MNEQVYKKKGRKYIPIGYSDGFTGFPTDGFWLVQQKDGSKSSECIIKIDELESLRPAADLILEYKNKIIRYLAESENCKVYNVSYDAFVSKMLKEITNSR